VDGKLRLRNLGAAKPALMLNPISAGAPKLIEWTPGVTRLAFSPDGKNLASNAGHTESKLNRSRADVRL
jgi:hypothetical protein